MERFSKAIPNSRVSKMVENSKLTRLSLTHEPLDPDTLCSLLRWIDAIRLSRPKKCLHRDFADAVLVAEIISHFFPAKVEVHNYTSASGYKGKLKNWKLLNSKVLSKFGHYIPALSAMHPDREPHPNCGVSKNEIEFMRNVINGKPNHVEIFLFELRKLIESEKRNIPLTEIDSDPSFMLQESTSLADLIGTPFEELNLEPLDQETKLQVHRQHQALLACHKKMKILWSQEKELQDSIQRKNNEIDRLKKQLNQCSEGQSVINPRSNAITSMTSGDQIDEYTN